MMVVMIMITIMMIMIMIIVIVMMLAFIACRFHVSFGMLSFCCECMPGAEHLRQAHLRSLAFRTAGHSIKTYAVEPLVQSCPGRCLEDEVLSVLLRGAGL